MFYEFEIINSLSNLMTFNREIVILCSECLLYGEYVLCFSVWVVT
jgi:hypothetical protein